MLRFHNTLSGRVEEFQPMKEGEVSFYYCGPTVWNYGHIGNFRSAVAADILRRYLKFKGFKVTHVMNITDVEDRIIAKSQEAGVTIDDYTRNTSTRSGKTLMRLVANVPKLCRARLVTFPRWSR